MIMAFCVPSLACFLAGVDLLHLTGSERAYLARDLTTAVSFPLSALPSPPLTGGVFLRARALGLFLALCDTDRALRWARGAFFTLLMGEQGGVRLTLMIASLLWTGGKPLVSRDSKLAREKPAPTHLLCTDAASA